jgi:hypothetical protein
MKKIALKDDEVVVDQGDFGFLVEEFIRYCLRSHCSIEPQWINDKLREWWPKLEEYHQRHIICDMELAIALDEPPRYNREPMDELRKFMWVQLVKDLRPPKHPFTTEYLCHKCKSENVKLWRGIHGCSNEQGRKLLCAACLAPDLKVDEHGKAMNISVNMETDQINNWLPAIPVDDTYWGYSSVPSQDVEWWKNLPTYKATND